MATPEPPDFSDISEQDMSELPNPQLTTPVLKESEGKSVAVEEEKAESSAVRRSDRLAKKQRLAGDENKYEEEVVDEDDAIEKDDVLEEDDLVVPTSLKGKAKRYVSHNRKWNTLLIYL